MSAGWSRAIAGADGDFLRALDHVVVGDDYAGLVNEEAGAQRGRRGAGAARAAAEEILKARRQALDRRAARPRPGAGAPRSTPPPGAPARSGRRSWPARRSGGATALGVISWALATRENSTGAAANPTHKAAAAAPAIRVRRTNRLEKGSAMKILCCGPRKQGPTPSVMQANPGRGPDLVLAPGSVKGALGRSCGHIPVNRTRPCKTETSIRAFTSSGLGGRGPGPALPARARGFRLRRFGR